MLVIYITHDDQALMTQFAALESPSGFDESNIYQSVGRCMTVTFITPCVTWTEIPLCYNSCCLPIESIELMTQGARSHSPNRLLSNYT